MLLENNAFLTRLSRMYESAKSSGTVQLTMKRVARKRAAAGSSAGVEIDENETVCLVRATLRSSKISTLVTAQEQSRFQVSFNNILKVHMDALKKKKKSRRTRRTQKES